MKILAVSPIYPAALEQLRQRHDVICAFGESEAVLKKLIRDREALIFRSGVSVNAEFMRCAPDLKLLVRAGSGVDNLDLAYLAAHEIQLTRIPEPGAQAVAEMSFAMMLSLARNLREADRLTRQGRWAKNEIIGHSLLGKVLGIVGAGNIGSRVGEMGAAWGMRPLGCVENNSETAWGCAAARLREKGIRLTSFDEVIAEADFLSIHVPLTNATRSLIDASVLSRMKSGAFLVNLARGGVVDEDALRYELTTGGRLRGAALDVHQAEGEGKVSPLADLPNVILTPHIGAMTIDSQREIGRRVVEIVDNFVIAYPAADDQMAAEPCLVAQ